MDSRVGVFTAGQAAFLNECRTGHLATVDPRGRPHNVPVCFAIRNEHIYIAIDEKPKQAAPGDLRRVRNLLANSSVCLVVDRYDEDWSRLAWLQVRGRAALTEDAAERAGAVDALRNRYPQYRSMALEDRPLIRIVVERIVAWQAAPDSASTRPRV
jgi:PPOX class probable F420-dependent enzyme